MTRDCPTVPVRAFVAWSTCYPEHVATVYARTAGAAKYARFLSMSDVDADLSFTTMRARVCEHRPPPRRFVEVCARRGIEFARIGMRVTVYGTGGVIVGANDSGNLDVIFDGKEHASNVHPWQRVTYYDDAGAVIRAYGDDRGTA